MRTSAAVVLVTFLLAGAACTAGDDRRLSKDEFIAQADEICAELDAELDEIEAAESPEELDSSIAELEEVADEGIQDLRDLRPPAEDEQKIARMLDGIEKAVRLLPELAEAGKANDTERLGNLSTEIQDAANQASRIAREYGFETCGGESAQPNE